MSEAAPKTFSRNIVIISIFLVFGIIGFITDMAIAESAPADAAAAAAMSAGDSAWVLACCALVLIMTPGLAFFYGGMVGAKNALNTVLLTFASIAVVGMVWMFAGYSLAFSPGNPLIGDLKWAGLVGVGQDANADYSATIPHILYMLFQSKFALITPALIVGAVVGRVRFRPWLLFVSLWSLLVYSPVAHWVWATTGWIRASGSIDFAGGLVVHITAGVSALVLALIFGRSKQFLSGNELRPYNPVFVALGTGMLAFGWLGFNAGSALSAGGLAALAASNTFYASSAALATWLLLEMAAKGRPTLVGSCVGTVVGLVGVTPAAGFVSVAAAFLIGGGTAMASFFAIPLIKSVFKIDDTLDVFASHGVGGIMGAILTAVFATKSVNPAGADGLLRGNTDLFVNQVIDTFAVVGYSAAVTAVLAIAIQRTVGFRVTETAEDQGLDSVYQGEGVPEYGLSESGAQAGHTAA